jgi:hypothetical protein
MAAHRIHAVVVPLEDLEAWGLVTDLDLIAAAYAGSDPTAGELASRPRLYVTPSDDIGRVTGLLRQDRLHYGKSEAGVSVGADGAPTSCADALPSKERRHR